jgi:hypothetical protein
MTKSRGILPPKVFWTESEKDIVRQLYPHTTNAEIIKLLGRHTERSLYLMAKKMGIKKSPEYFKLHGARLDGVIGTESRFKAGSTPWNKGMHYFAGGRSADTQFKKGRKPEESRNYQPIGTLRISKDGYLERKISDDISVNPARRWQAVHRLVWEASNGVIPAGHLIVFKKGMFTNQIELLTVDRLECISRAENARRNSKWKSDPEMLNLYRLKGQINRAVNRIKKESEHV